MFVPDDCFIFEGVHVKLQQAKLDLRPCPVNSSLSYFTNPISQEGEKKKHKNNKINNGENEQIKFSQNRMPYSNWNKPTLRLIKFRFVGHSLGLKKNLYKLKIVFEINQ